MANSQASIFARLPPPAECLAILIGCAELSIFGIRGISNPRGWLQGFGLPPLDQPSVRISTDTDRSKQDDRRNIHSAQRALIDALAARNVQNGALILTFALVLKDRRALGVTVLAGLITTMADTVVAWRYGVKGAVLGHLMGIANCIGIGGALLTWQRDVIA